MKKRILVPLLLLAGAASAYATSPASCPPAGCCDDCICCDSKCAEGESTPAAQQRTMTAELARLVNRYVSHAAMRGELLRTVQSDPQRALDFVAQAKATFCEADRACFQRVTDHFKC